uniref:Uncharacterized protein n=1 Tax=Anguilla anguilla TaxID=7936 RepID=A0A0E9XBV3_ANGAN
MIDYACPRMNFKGITIVLLKLFELV